MKAAAIIIIILALITFAYTEVIKARFFEAQVPSMPQLPQNQKTPSSFLEIPSTPVVFDQKGRSCINMCIGSSKQCFNFVIQAGSFHMWVVDKKSKQNPDHKFDPALSKTLERKMEEMELTYKEYSVIGYTGKDELFIEGTSVGKVNFLISTRSDSFTGFDGMIGLGYTPNTKEEKYSIIEQLYNNNIIFHKVFTQTFDSGNKGEITFGEIPQRIVDDYEHYGRCHAVDKITNGEKVRNKHWQCALTSIQFGNEYTKPVIREITNAKISFFSYRKRALVPLEFFEYLEQTYFKDLIQNGKCQRKFKRYDTIVCNEEIQWVYELTLVFGDWGMKLEGKHLFKFDTIEKEYEFVFYHKKDYEKWTLGRPIVRYFQMVYDTHNSEIGFYDPKKVVYLGSGRPEPPKIHVYVPDKNPKPIETPDDIKKPEHPINKPIPPDNESDGRVEQGNNQPQSAVPFIQKLLVFFVVLAGLFLLVVAFFTYLQFRKRHRMKHKYSSQNTENLIKH